MSNELKPCPFCGNKNPEIIDDRVGFFVRCLECKPYPTVIYGDNVRYIDHMVNDDDAQTELDNIDFDMLRRSAVDAWNRRSQEDSEEAPTL